MKFRNYSIIILGELSDITLGEVFKAAQDSPSIMKYKDTDVVVATFTSALEVNELNDYLKTFGFNFLFFDLNSDCGFNINNESVHKDLFGDIKTKNVDELQDLTNKMMDEIYKSRKTFKSKKAVNTRKSIKKDDVIDIEVMVDGLDKSGIECMINDILDKGSKNMSELDKAIMDNLVKKYKD